MLTQYQSLDEHIALLQSKGYTEAGLNMPHAPDTINHLLREAYREYTSFAVLTGKREHFTLVISARFDNAQDKVQYRMMYRVDPAENGMHLFAMSAQMADLKKLYIIGPKGAIDSANSLYQELVGERTKRVVNWLATRNVNPLKKIHHL